MNIGEVSLTLLRVSNIGGSTPRAGATYVGGYVKLDIPVKMIAQNGRVPKTIDIKIWVDEDGFTTGSAPAIP